MTCSLGGAAAGITSLLLWNDTFHLRLGVGMAAAGAVYAALAMSGRRREQAARRREMTEVRKDAAAELRFEVGRREGQISHLRLRVRESEETVLLFEQRAVAQQARADAEASARIQAEYDLAALTQWVHEARAAAELTRSAVQSFHAVQSYEPLAQLGYAADAYAPNSYDTDAYASESYGTESYVPSAPAAAYTQPPQAPAPDSQPVPHGQPTPAVYETVPELKPVGAKQASRPLRSTVLADRTEVGFDVASNVYSAPEDPYLVPGVTLPRARNRELAAGPPTRPIAPERLYRPYLSSGGGDFSEQANRQENNAVDLTAYDDTTQFTAVDRYQTGTG